jgi:PleD family two-component response regulator
MLMITDVFRIGDLERTVLMMMMTSFSTAKVCQSRKHSSEFASLLFVFVTTFTGHSSTIGTKMFSIDDFVTALTTETTLMEIFAIELTENFASEKRFLAD